MVRRELSKFFIAEQGKLTKKCWVESKEILKYQILMTTKRVFRLKPHSSP